MAVTAGQWHVLIAVYGSTPQASGILYLAVLVDTTGQWHALIDCYGQHYRGVPAAEGSRYTGWMAPCNVARTLSITGACL